MPGENKVFAVKQRSGKQPLAKYLAARLGVVQPWAEDLLRNGHVALDDQPADENQLINLSQGSHTIEVRFPHDWPKHMAPKQMDLDFLHQDEHLAVVNKPPGIVVHPARGHLTANTLQNGLRYAYRHLIALPGTTIGSPHRLDKDTSGAIVFALKRDVYANLVQQFSRAKPHKQYLAVVAGNPDFDYCVCDKPIGPHPERKGYGAVVPEERGGKISCTDFAVVERFDGWAILNATPRTGRPHQIRIHAAYLGLPLAGDADYNPNPEFLGFKRQALHAAILEFIHPATGVPLRVNAPLAPDIAERIQALRNAQAKGTTL